MAEQEATGGNGIFENRPQSAPCSWNECLAGHRWPPTMALAGCPGCGGGILAVRQENCPFCNEPVRAMNLRTDLVPAGAGATARCKGVTPGGESIDVEMARQGYRSAAQAFRTFEQKRAEALQKKIEETEVMVSHKADIEVSDASIT